MFYCISSWKIALLIVSSPVSCWKNIFKFDKSRTFCWSKVNSYLIFCMIENELNKNKKYVVTNKSRAIKDSFSIAGCGVIKIKKSYMDDIYGWASKLLENCDEEQKIRLLSNYTNTFFPSSYGRRWCKIVSKCTLEMRCLLPQHPQENFLKKQCQTPGL